MAYEKVRVLVSGATGFVGQRLIERLKSKDRYEIFTLHKGATANPYVFEIRHGKDFWEVDLSDQEPLKIFGPFGTVFSLAASTTRGTTSSEVANLTFANSTLPALLLSQVGAHSSHFVHMGTFSHKSDSSEYDPQTFYAATKRSGERYLEFLSRESSALVTVLHTYDIYGPKHPHRRIVPTIIRSLIHGEQIRLILGTQDYSPIFIDDIVNLFETYADEGPMQVSKYAEFDLHGPDVLKIGDLPKIIAKVLGLPLKAEQVTVTTPTQHREITKFNPCHPLPPQLKNLTSFRKGIEMIGLNY